MNKWAKFLLIPTLFFATEKFCRMQTAGFSTQKIYSEIPYSEKWNIAPLSKENREFVDKCLHQKFYFLGSGVQCYAFLGEDGETVLKFFKHYHMCPNNTILAKAPLPKSWKNQIIKERIEKMEFIFQSLKIAYEDLQSQTQTFFLHLNKTLSGAYPKITLVDKIHISHEIDLNQTSFVLQKKANLFCSELLFYVKNHQIEKAKSIIDHLFEIIILRSKKGIVNCDPVIIRNIGLVNEQPIELDVGSFYKNPFINSESAIKRELFYETIELKEWLLVHSPELHDYLVNHLQNTLSKKI
ncbi:MAG: hypothetical protein L0207_03545 [Chlamydiae bacterium]|nr:hypothetical protein [Chlamydiota bacterium]